MKTDIIIQARLGSKRFPEKVIKPIGRFSSLELIYKRVSKSKEINDIIFAIPNNKENNKTQQKASSTKWRAFRAISADIFRN